MELKQGLNITGRLVTLRIHTLSWCEYFVIWTEYTKINCYIFISVLGILVCKYNFVALLHASTCLSVFYVKQNWNIEELDNKLINYDIQTFVSDVYYNSGIWGRAKSKTAIWNWQYFIDTVC